MSKQFFLLYFMSSIKTKRKILRILCMCVCREAYRIIKGSWEINAFMGSISMSCCLFCNAVNCERCMSFHFINFHPIKSFAVFFFHVSRTHSSSSFMHFSLSSNRIEIIIIETVENWCDKYFCWHKNDWQQMQQTIPNQSAY